MRIFLTLLVLLTSPLVGADAWVCPMHCEGTKTYAKPGKCPVCGMELEKAGEPAKPLNNRDFRVDQVLEPKPLRAGQEGTLTLIPRHTKDGSVVKKLHESLRATLFTADLTKLDRLKLEALPDGGFQAKVKPSAGSAAVVVEFTPEGASRQIFPLPIAVDGESAKAAAKPLEVSGAITWSFPSKSKKPEDCLLLREDTTYFERVPVKSVGGKFRCQVTPPRAGDYRLFYSGKSGGEFQAYHVH